MENVRNRFFMLNNDLGTVAQFTGCPQPLKGVHPLKEGAFDLSGIDRW